jgi:transcriptional regulator with XRE-family HTH domain
LTFFRQHRLIAGMDIAEIGQLVHQRRIALGLSQARLASLSGLSRATINQLETGALVDLGVAKLMALLDVVGLAFHADLPKARLRALQSVSQTASVSYKLALEPAALAAALVDGELPPSITPQIATLLDEAPLALIVAAIEEVAVASKQSPKLLWKHLLQWARDLDSPREVWA